MVNKIIVDKFIKKKILTKLAILLEKMLTNRILEDKIPISFQNLLHLSKEATFIIALC